MDSEKTNVVAMNERFSSTSAHVDIEEYREGAFGNRCASVVEELEVELVVNEFPITSLNCSPWDIEKCVLGYLFFKGVISHREMLKSIIFDEEKCRMIVTIKGGDVLGEHILFEAGFEEKLPFVDEEALWPSQKTLSLDAGSVNRLINELEEDCHLFHRTGGVHSAALADHKGIICRFEDVSRQSALDKLLGHCLLRSIPTDDKILLFSGRMPSSIVARARVLGCSIMISPGAPTDQSIVMAEQSGITLIGFAKQGCFNIYTHAYRVRRCDQEQNVLMVG